MMMINRMITRIKAIVTSCSSICLCVRQVVLPCHKTQPINQKKMLDLKTFLYFSSTITTIYMWLLIPIIALQGNYSDYGWVSFIWWHALHSLFFYAYSVGMSDFVVNGEFTKQDTDEPSRSNLAVLFIMFHYHLHCATICMNSNWTVFTILVAYEMVDTTVNWLCGVVKGVHEKKKKKSSSSCLPPCPPPKSTEPEPCTHQPQTLQEAVEYIPLPQESPKVSSDESQ